VVDALRKATFLLVVIVIIFAVGLLALRRWSRRYSARLLREPRESTRVEDLWTMHKLPEAEEATSGDESEDEDGENEDGDDENSVR